MSIGKFRLSVLTSAIFIATVTLALQIASKPTSADADKARSRANRSELSTERISRHVQFLASDKLQGRRAGTANADEAADYIAREFKSYGLKPSSSAGFLQAFTFVSGVKLGEQNRFHLKVAGTDHALTVGQEFMPLAFSPAQPTAGEVVFVGYGISAPELQFDSYSGVDPKDKIVLVLRGSP